MARRRCGGQNAWLAMKLACDRGAPADGFHLHPYQEHEEATVGEHTHGAATRPAASAKPSASGPHSDRRRLTRPPKKMILVTYKIGAHPSYSEYYRS